ncbi:glycosyltransferase [Paraburkholderia sp. J11-2]|uniref:glycosyltransferase n=1 Tax=Paraburkholderia sp. J11-2 TaxID=2805431 RepID=UPI002AB6B59D|nr:glycosyltransferase [Paraburkholderia sp. J11-2]
MQDNSQISYWASGNEALRNRKYENAIQLYQKAKATTPELSHLIEESIQLAKRRIRDKRRFAQNDAAESVDIVVPVFNALDDVKLCLQALELHTDEFNVRVIVVNDGSQPDTTEWLRSYCSGNALFTLIEHATNQGYTRTVNTGLKASRAPYVITQNSDTIVSSGWLRGLVRCMESDAKLGIVGPLSNAASWQNVPALRDETGSFAVNQLPQGLTVDDMAALVADTSEPSYPRLPFVNGFCFMIRRAVIDAIGYMDEVNFPVGYGEENDFCIRAIDAGFELAVADDVYVFHAKSKSFGHSRRKELSAQGTESLKRKHTADKYYARVADVKRTELLDQVRYRVQAAIEARSTAERIELMSMRILFLLPVKGGGGGSHSVVQEVSEMRRMGIQANVAVKYEHVTAFREMYSDVPGIEDVFVGFDECTILQIADDYDVVVGTIFTSMKLVKRIVSVYPYILPAYYVQDYEPYFFEEDSAKWHEARDSYTLVPGALLFAKTQWIADVVKLHHGVTVHRVRPSIDHEVYKPVRRSNDERMHVTAMIRPQTPYRGAERTMRLLRRLHQTLGDQLVVNIFGCDGGNAEFLALERDYPFQNHGLLKRPQVAALLANSDLFIDLSDYQAFGRTSLEAMACGCAVAVPANGGGNEYAEHRRNALVLDTLNEEACFEAVASLLSSPQRLQSMRRAGLQTAAGYSVHSAAVSECLPIEKSLKVWRMKYPRHDKPLLLLMPGMRGDGLPAGSGYVRVVLPYQSPAVLRDWQVKQAEVLPEPGTAHAVLMQRDAIGFKLAELEDWLPRWKDAGGRLVYEIDDDLLDAQGLKARHYKGDAHAVAAKVRLLAGAADLVHVSTPSLAELMRQINSNVVVIPNALDADLWRLEGPRQHNQGSHRRLPNGPIRIGYIGTPTHDEDLDLVTEAMKQIEKKYGSLVEIEVIGGFQNRTPTFGKRVALSKKNDYPNFVRWLQERVHWDIGIIALAENQFNESKSYLKFLEYAALDVAIVVSAGSTYEPVARHRHNALVARSTDEWVECISSLIESPSLRDQLALQARSDVSEGHTLAEVGPMISAAFVSKIGAAR